MPDKILGLLPYIYLGIVSLVALLVTVYDKWVSKHRPDARIRERTLFLLAAFGGSFAMFLTMQAVRHKTKHFPFMIGIPCIMVLQVVAIFAVDYFFLK